MFELTPQDASRLLRLPFVKARCVGAVRTMAINLVWHDTADATLAAQGLALCRVSTGRRGTEAALWRLERLTPEEALDWPPATCPRLLAQGDTAIGMCRVPASGLAPAAAFTGRSRSSGLRLDSGPGRLEMLEGAMRGIAGDQPACNLLITGSPANAAAFSLELAASLRLRVPRHSLAAAAAGFARNSQPAPLRTGTPALPPVVSTSDALAGIVGHLAHVILHWSDRVPQAATPEPVHQMRVAVRRLRSALSLFRRAATGGAQDATWLFELSAALRDLAARLGAARDWDVFIGGTGAAAQATFPQDRRIGLLLAAAGRKRASAYADLATFLGGDAWARLSLQMALLPATRPWEHTGNPDLLEAPARLCAAHALDRRLKQLLAFGADLSGHPAERLHDLRKQAKRLRYATEFFAPLFAGKAARKYLRKLERLQEVLGAVNDTAAAAALLDQLAGGTDRAFAAGVIQGLGAARGGRAAAKVQVAWERFRRALPFWD